LGKKLAPASAWGAWGEEIDKTMNGKYKGTSFQGGVININMRLPVDKGDVNGYRSLTVQPSDIAPAGVAFISNHHHQTDLPKDVAKLTDNVRDKLSKEESTTLLLDCLSKNFEESIDTSMSIIQEVLNP
jgi:hypothetical protein